MQSDPRIRDALLALAPRIALFRYAVATTLDRARATLGAESGPNQARATLGDFGARFLDPERFAMISSAGPLDAAARDALERVAGLLQTVQSAGDNEFVVEVAPGASVVDAVRARFALLGLVFDAAITVEQVRRRVYDASQQRPDVGYPFERWSAGDRKLAPPLVVSISGTDLDGVCLAPLIDGCARIVFVVNGPATVAPLARLVSPGVFVAQADDVKVLERVREFEGPAVVAVMSDGEARFVHDPRAGSAAWQRIEATAIPAVSPRKSVGTRSAWQQREDLAHLKSLVEQPVFAVASGPTAIAASTGVTTSDPTERLTSWLLDQSGLAAQPVAAP